MSIKIATEYVNAEPPDADYPGGSFKNETAPAAGDGTPLEKAWADCLWGFGEAILAESGVVPSGAPDNAVASDRLAGLKLILADLNNPVGTIRAFAVDTDPAELLGVGTWVRLGAGRTVIDAGTGFTAGTVGGEVTHTLTIAESARHKHNWTKAASYDNENETIDYIAAGQPRTWKTFSVDTDYSGGGAAHNNMPPYYVGYLWRRTV